MNAAIITGQSRGLGQALADAFRGAGYSVPRCTRDEMDVTDGRSILGFVDSLGSVDVLINNAAILGPVGELETNDWREWEETIRVNLLGPVFLTRMILPHLSEGARIINIAGGGATGPLPRRSAYASSKAALVRFTECLAEEVRGRGISVNAILPGPLPTDMRQEIVDAGEDVELTGPGAIERAVALCLYLASEESHGLTGKIFSARYDDFPFPNQRKSDIIASDIFTLRRIDGDKASRIGPVPSQDI